MSVRFSFEECVPKRPPRPQKLPLASGTVQFDTPNGFDSAVMSAIHTICRASRHSLAVDSLVITRKSRTPASVLPAELGNFHAQHRKHRVRADVRRQVEPADLRIQQILVGRLLRTVQQLLAIDDLDDCLRPTCRSRSTRGCRSVRGNRAVQASRRRAHAAGLLSGQPEIADEHRLGRIAQIVDLRHAIDAPARRAGDQIRDAGVAFPPVLVRAAESADDDRHARRAWTGSVTSQIS